MNKPNRQPALHALEKDRTWRLGLLVAPQGSGKQRYLNQWVEIRRRYGAGIIAWLKLEPAHNDPRCFWDDLYAVIIRSGPPNSPSTRLAGLMGDEADQQELVIELANCLAQISQPVAIILYGYDAIRAEPIHQIVRQLIDSLPPQAQLVIVACSEPPLQQARLRARRELVELGPADL